MMIKASFRFPESPTYPRHYTGKEDKINRLAGSGKDRFCLKNDSMGAFFWFLCW